MKKLPQHRQITRIALIATPAALLVGAALALLVNAHSPSAPATTENEPPPVAEKSESLLTRLASPILPAPTPRSEKDEAIYQLSLQKLEPTADALAAHLQSEAPTRVSLFLKAGVAASGSTTDGRPLIVIASGSGNSENLAALLAAGANANAATSTGLTPLMAAAQKGDRELLKLLVDEGAELTTADGEGHTALHHAIIASQPQTARWLAEAGLPPTPCCEGEKNVALHALETQNPEVLEAALTLEKPETWHPSFATALLEAARTGDRTMTQLLLAHHDTSPPHPESRHPLVGYAVAWGNHELLQILLECGADPNAPLGSPVEEAFAELTPQKFMQYYLRREPGLTPLMLAAGRGDLASVEALLQHGAKPNALSGKSRWPALSFAAQSQSVEVMQRLLGKSPAPEDQHTRIEISLSQQTARLWKNNELAFTTRISTGRAGYRTPTGRFVITDKTRNRISSIYRVNMPYFMRLNCSAIGMHAGNVPGYPASHGCIRLPAGTAAKFFREVPVGTLVTIQ